MHEQVLSGNSEMAERMRGTDWARTAVGPISQWPEGLKTAVSICLGSRYPIVIWWGRKSLTQFYNDGYIPVLGRTKHPQWLGRSGAECWTEIGPIIGPMWEGVFETGEATWSEDLTLIMDRNVPQEETFFTFSYSPIRNDSGAVEGIFCACQETTGRVVGERRLRALRDLGQGTSGASTAEEACQEAISALARNPDDVPFAAIYLTDDAGGRASLVASSGLEIGSPAAPVVITLREPHESEWPLSRLFHSGKAELVTSLGTKFGLDVADTAMVLPIGSPGQLQPAGFLIAGLSRRRVFDTDYRDFLDLIVGHVSSGIASARAYEAERRRAEALIELDRAKTAFFSNVSHEFRTPLTLMLGPLEEALSGTHGPLTEEISGPLSLSRRNGHRLLKLVNTLLDFSRIEAGRVEASYEPHDLSLLTTDIASSFRSAIEAAGLDLVVDCPQLSEPIYVDREMWEKIVLNLISNAFKFTFEGSITVSIRSVDDNAQLTVTDTGVGIPADQLPRVFERFHRVRNARSRTHEGTGIGLALVQELVKLHGGFVTARSEHGSGSAFTVSVPKGMAHLPADRIAADKTLSSTAFGAVPFVDEALRWLPTTDAPSEVDSRVLVDDLGANRAPLESDARPRVLLADDNSDMRDYVRGLLARRYRFTSVADGRAALESIIAAPPDLVLADVMMPGLDGFELLAAVRADERTRTLPVVLISARAGEESRLEGLAAGADDYLVKPFTSRELQAVVESQLNQARMRNETERQLRNRAEQFETLLSRAPLGVYLADADLRILEVNPIASLAAGPVPGGLLGRSISEILHFLLEESAAESLVQICRDTLETGDPHVELEQPLYRVDRGATEYYEWRLDRITLPDGRYGLVCYFRDVSSQVLARAAIEESREALREADRRKDQFLATLAHELRNPLAPIASGLHALRLPEIDEATTERLHRILNRQVDHMVRLVDDLLEVARITRGKIELRKERVDLGAIVESAAELVKPYIGERRHHLVLDVPDRPIYLDADPVRIEQVLANLLNNAAKYTEDDGTIWLGIGLDGDRAVVSVRDNGIGIAADMLPKVFDLFTQLEGGGLAKGGLGIGLTLVKTLVELHGGTVEVRSEGIGTGSEFIVKLPLAAEQAAKEDFGSMSSTPAIGRHRVLVVDDHRDAADALKTLLELMGVEARVAYDGATSLELIRSFRPTAVLLDIGMPGMDGHEVARRARQHPAGRAAALIALTGWGQEQDFERSQAAGIDHHIVKPASRARLEALLAKIPVAEASELTPQT